MSKSIIVSAISNQVNASAASARNAEAESPGDEAREQAGGELHERITRADRRLAVGALAAQRQPAHHGNVLQGGDRRLALRARRAWRDDVVGRLRGHFAAGPFDGKAAHSARNSLSIMMGTRWITTLRKLPTSRPSTTHSAMNNAGFAASVSKKPNCCDIKVPIEKRRPAKGAAFPDVVVASGRCDLTPRRPA